MGIPTELRHGRDDEQLLNADDDDDHDDVHVDANDEVDDWITAVKKEKEAFKWHLIHNST